MWFHISLTTLLNDRLLYLPGAALGSIVAGVLARQRNAVKVAACVAALCLLPITIRGSSNWPVHGERTGLLGRDAFFSMYDVPTGAARSHQSSERPFSGVVPSAPMSAILSAIARRAASVADRNDLPIGTRRRFVRRLSGRGLEIGALHLPMATGRRRQIEYVDRLPLQELRRQYPELNHLPLVAPDILDDAETLGTVPDGEYAFVIAAHLLEHMRNPLRALETWCRVLRPEGLIYLVVPHPRHSFDRLRSRTLVEHLILDYEQPSTERDYEHYLEHAVCVDHKRGRDALAHAASLQAWDYSIHFHVFEPDHLVRALTWFSANIRPIDIVNGPAIGLLNKGEFHLLLRAPPG